MSNALKDHPSADTPGIDFVFNAGLQKIDEQLKSVESLDVKMGVLIGFLGAIIAGLLVALLASDSTKVRALLAGDIVEILISVVWVLFAADPYFAFQAFRVRQYYLGVRFKDLVPWANEDVHDTKKAFLPTLVKTVDLNERLLALKQLNGARAVWSVFATLLALLVTVALIGARIVSRAGG